MSPSQRDRHDAAVLAARDIVPPAPSTVDLHLHTVRSDGVLEPDRLLADVAAAGVRVAALTDHDTMAGYREVLRDGAVPAELTLIAGVEINAIVPKALGIWEAELHILGFGMDPDDDAFEAVLRGQRDQRRRRFEKTVARLRDVGAPIDTQVEPILAADGDDALGRPTVARALIAAGHATSVEDAFARYLSGGKPAYVPREGLDPFGAIAAIRAAGGLAALAHFGEAADHLDVLHQLVDAGLAGLEVHYRSFDRATTEAVGAIATSLDLFSTGGTDYHGDQGSYAEAHAGLWVPPQVGETLLARLAERRTMARP